MLTIPAAATSSPSLDVSVKGAVEPKGGSSEVIDCANDLECTNAKMDSKLETEMEPEKPSKETNGAVSQGPPHVPKHEIVYSNGLDLGKFWMDSNIDADNKLEVPKDILLRVFLPEVMNASEVELDVSDTQALLVVPDIYKLQVKWRYTVDSGKGSAKFDKVNHKLEVLLPTRPALSAPA